MIEIQLQIYCCHNTAFTDPANQTGDVDKSYLIKYVDSGQGNAKNRVNNVVAFGVPTPGGEW